MKQMEDAPAGAKQKGLVVGAGLSGQAAVRALVELFGQADIYDQKKPEDFEPATLQKLTADSVKTWFGGAEPDDLSTYDCLVVSPGVPLDHSLVSRAREAGVEIIGEVELAWRYGRGRYVAITGTNGKTTTTSLTGEIFKAADLPTEVVGNIGVAVVDHALQSGSDTWLVTEISSFQLETTRLFRPQISAILNLTPDHMDRHHTMDNYAQAKALVFHNQTSVDYCVANLDDPLVVDMLDNCRAIVFPFSRLRELDQGCFVQNDTIVLRTLRGQTIPVCRVNELGIPGNHNLENALAATAIAHCAGIRAPIIAHILKSFEGVEHRLEYSGTVNKIHYVNDSKATNSYAAIKAIEVISGNVILIAGGYDKGSRFDSFIDAFGTKVKGLVLLGETAPQLKQTALDKGYDNIVMVKGMKEAVSTAAAMAEPGDTVLLSPACASWDMYNSFEERGEHFKQCVKELSLT
ncbi:MAG TPA: UDP-N-acetylmuramoyl-L-alanine--D-glutamate ligase [Clostridiales bacterium]|nr:UDP-N-acetylmuramoyl-L-alanine--D-glutamate ligase [Clostridiales bacterium]